MDFQPTQTKTRIAMVEVNVYSGMTPLGSGYLQAYATADPEISENYIFEKHSVSVDIDYQELENDLIALNCDIYTFSCYAWNIELMKKLIAALKQAIPKACYLLGGPEVMHQGHRYLDPGFPRMFVCNGEGEKTFAQWLKELKKDKPDFRLVKGLSFYQGNELVTTEPQERITNLDEIPSPFLNGIFDGYYLTSILETNRGCPFRCSFCHWGAATNDRVYKFDKERVKNEIAWISKKGIPSLYIADANWGMLKSDIDMSQHIANCAITNSAPLHVYFSSAKNSPDRVSEITRIFTKAGLIHTQPISMQSLDERTLEFVDRKNIKLSAYQNLQEDLNARGINSYIELIFPLPGETLESFTRGLTKLFETNASSIEIYCNLLLENTPQAEYKDKHKLVTRSLNDGVASANVVVETADINPGKFEAGMWLIYSVYALFNTHSIDKLSRYLHQNKLESFGKFYTKFSHFLRESKGNFLTTFIENSIESGAYHNINNYPNVYFMVLHDYRYEFEELLHEFASSQSWWEDENTRALFEFDMLTRPFIYSNTPFLLVDYATRLFHVLESEERCYQLEVSPELVKIILPDEIKTEREMKETRESIQLKINHTKSQFPLRKNLSTNAIMRYTYGCITRISEFKPTIEKIIAVAQ